jgi:hypothetical protein
MHSLLNILSGAVAGFRRWFTWRRALHIAAMLVLLISIQQLMLAGADLTILFGMDWGLALEVSAVLIFAAARVHAIAILQITRQKLLAAFAVLAKFYQRGATRAFRARSQKPHSFPPPSDEDGWAWA